MSRGLFIFPTCSVLTTVGYLFAHAPIQLITTLFDLIPLIVPNKLYLAIDYAVF